MDFDEVLSRVPTPHNAARKDQIADVVLMPGDPMRSRWIADAFFEEAQLVNNIRGMQCYTGYWQGRRVTTMASGIGIPSISVFAYELFNFYDVKTIIRVGTAGSIQEDVHVGDIIICDEAFTTSNIFDYMDLPEDYVPRPTRLLLNRAINMAAGMDIKGKVHVGSVLSEDLYYCQKDLVSIYQEKGVLAFEMEAAALFALAKDAGKNALAVFTVSNEILNGTEMPPKERENSLKEMVEIALRAAFIPENR